MRAVCQFDSSDNGVKKEGGEGLPISSLSKAQHGQRDRLVLSLVKGLLEYHHNNQAPI